MKFFKIEVTNIPVNTNPIKIQKDEKFPPNIVDFPILILLNSDKNPKYIAYRA